MRGKKRVVRSPSPMFRFSSDNEDNQSVSEVTNTQGSRLKNSNHDESTEPNLQTRQKSPTPPPAPSRYSFRSRKAEALYPFTLTKWVNPETIPNDPYLDLEVLCEPVEGFDFEAKTVPLKHRDQVDEDFVPRAVPVSPDHQPRKYRRLFKRSHLSPPPVVRLKRTFGRNPTRLRMARTKSSIRQIEPQTQSYHFDIPSSPLPSAEDLFGLSTTYQNRNRLDDSPLYQGNLPSSPPLPAYRTEFFSPLEPSNDAHHFTFSDSEIDYRLPFFALPPPKTKSHTKTRARHLSFFTFYQSQLPSLYYVPQWLKLVHRTYKNRERLGLNVVDSPWDKWIFEEKYNSSQSTPIRFKYHSGPRQFQSAFRTKIKPLRFNGIGRTKRDNGKVQSSNSSNQKNGPKSTKTHRPSTSTSPTVKIGANFKIRPPKLTPNIIPTPHSPTNALFRNDHSIPNIEVRYGLEHSTEIANTINNPELNNHSNQTNQQQFVGSDHSSSHTLLTPNTNVIDQETYHSNPQIQMGSHDVDIENSVRLNDLADKGNCPKEADSDILVRLGFFNPGADTHRNQSVESGLSNSNISLTSGNTDHLVNQNFVNMRHQNLTNRSADPQDTTVHPTLAKGETTSAPIHIFEPATLTSFPHNNLNHHQNSTNDMATNHAPPPEKSLTERKTWLNQFSERLWRIHHPELPKLAKVKHVGSIAKEDLPKSLELPYQIDSFDYDFTNFNSESSPNLSHPVEVVIQRDDITKSATDFEYGHRSPRPRLSEIPTWVISSEDDAFIDEASTQSRGRPNRPFIIESSSPPPPSPTDLVSMPKPIKYAESIELDDWEVEEIVDEGWDREIYDWHRIDLVNFMEESDLGNLTDSIELFGREFQLTIPKHVNILFDWGTNYLCQTVMKVCCNVAPDRRTVDDLSEYLSWATSLADAHTIPYFSIENIDAIIHPQIKHILNSCQAAFKKVVHWKGDARFISLQLVLFVHLKTLKLLHRVQRNGSAQSIQFTPRLKQFCNQLILAELNELLVEWELQFNPQTSRNKCLETIWKEFFKLFKWSNPEENWDQFWWECYCEFLAGDVADFERRLGPLVEYARGQAPSWCSTHWHRELMMTIRERTLIALNSDPSIRDSKLVGPILGFGIDLIIDPSMNLLNALPERFRPKGDPVVNPVWYAHWMDRCDIVINQLRWIPNEQFLLKLFRLYVNHKYLNFTPHQLILHEFDFIGTFQMRQFDPLLNPNQFDFFKILQWFKIYLNDLLKSSNESNQLSRNLSTFLSKIAPTVQLRLKLKELTESEEYFHAFVNRSAVIITLASCVPPELFDLAKLIKLFQRIFVMEIDRFDYRAFHLVAVTHLNLLGMRALSFDEPWDSKHWEPLIKILQSLHAKCKNNTRSIEQLEITEFDLHIQVLTKLYQKITDLLGALSPCETMDAQCNFETVVDFMVNISLNPDVVSPLNNLPHQVKYHYLKVFHILHIKMVPCHSFAICPGCERGKNTLNRYMMENEWLNKLSHLKQFIRLDEPAEHDLGIDDHIDWGTKVSIPKFIQLIEFWENWIRSN